MAQLQAGIAVCLLLFWQLQRVQAQTTATTVTTCLPDAVPPSLRKNVLVDGVSMPLGIWGYAWQSAAMNIAIFKLLASEVLGYNTTIPATSPVVYSGVWALVGCPEIVIDEAQVGVECPTDGNFLSTSHLLLESWDFWLKSTFEIFKKGGYEEREPIRAGGELGDLGWDGTCGTWLPQGVLEDGLQDGVILNNWLSYNASNFDLSPYFSSLEDVNTTEFFDSASRCRDFWPMNGDDSSRAYNRNFPDDTDGVETYLDAQGTERMRGRCEDGVWWLSPACRADRSRCIPWISTFGWGYELIWHKVTYYNMPIAMASTANWVNVVQSKSVLNYAWDPDATFVGRDLTQLLFPINDPELDDAYLYTTMFRAVKASKWGHRDLPKNTPRIWWAATKMNLTKSMLNRELEYAALHGLSADEGACHFLRERRDWWEGWVIPDTNCPEGQGLLVNELGDYECDWCPRATASVEGTVPSTGAATRYCEDCAVGTYQDLTQTTACLPCAAGTYADTNATQVCAKCKQGFYQPSQGSSACLQCPAGRTTRVLQATSLQDCLCDKGTLEGLGAKCEEEGDDCGCSTCMTGLDCPVGSSLKTWMQKVELGADTSDSESIPQVAPGYYSLRTQPESIYSCKEESACPGGEPESCSGGRILLTCTRCPSHHFLSQDGECKECEGWEPYLAFGSAIVAILALTMGHVAVNWPTTNTTEWTLTSVILAGMGLTTCLTFNIYANLDFDAMPPLTDLFAALKIMAFDVEILRSSCLTGSDSLLVKYSTKLACIPVCFFALCIGSSTLSLMPKWKSRAAFSVAGLQNSMGMIVTIFFISVSLMSLEAFRCDIHPNGQTSLSSDRSILCWVPGAHGDLVVLSICAILAYPLPFLTCTAVMTWNYSAWTRRCGSSFIMRSRFLFNRMMPGNVGFAFWYNIRNFTMTIVPIVAASDYNIQINLLTCIFCVWLAAQTYWRPWRFELLNQFDTFTSITQILMLNNFAMLSETGVHTSSVKPEVLVAWTIIGLFAMVMLGILLLGLSRLMRRLSKRKEYAIFLSHHKESSGRFARQIKLMLGSVTSRKVFLDVDELSNLDNLNFTIRSNTEQVVVLLTEEALTRLWIAVEVVSAITSGVPLHLVAANTSVSKEAIFTEEWLRNVPHMWAGIDVLEFLKIGFQMRQLESSYRYVATLPMKPLQVEAPFEDQWQQVQCLTSGLSIPTKPKDFAHDPSEMVFLSYDSGSKMHTCTARILALLFQQRRWKVYLQDDLPTSDCTSLEVVGAIVLLSKKLLENLDCVAHIAALHSDAVPIITILSGEPFWKPDAGYFNQLRAGLLFGKSQHQMLEENLPGVSLRQIGDALERLYKILAWRFNPEESEPLMMTEFNRVWERVQVERKRVSFSRSSKVSGISGASSEGSGTRGCVSLGLSSEMQSSTTGSQPPDVGGGDKMVAHFRNTSV